MNIPSVIERQLVQQVDPGQKYVLAVAQLYKGILIFQTVDGFCAYDEHGNRLPFGTLEEAKAAVDTYETLVACAHMLGAMHE